MDERETRRTGYPLTIPQSLLQSEAMQRACAERDFQEIFRLVNRRTGTSHAVMAAAIGRMTSTRVSDIVRGVRGIRGQQVIERVADGFGIPGDMLGVPPRPWEGSPKEGVPSEVPAYADSDQETPGSAIDSAQEIAAPRLPDALLLSVLIEGRRQVVPVNRRELIAAITGTALSTRDATKFPAPTGSRESTPHPRLNHSHVEAATEHLKDMWHSLVRADNLFGPRHALSSVRQQLSILESLLEYARGAQRLDLLGLAAQYAESAAWLYEDSADMSNASTWTSQAMEWAIESGDQAMVAWTLFRRSQQATTRKNAAQTISLAQAVQRNEQVLTSPMRASAMQQEAHGYALDGDERACHNRLDEAQKFAASPETKGDARSGHGDFCTPSYIEIQRANCWLSLRRPDLAVPVFEHALSELPDAYQRDRGFTQARLAMAYAEVQRYDESAAQATSALTIARSSGSMRTMHEAVAATNLLGAVHTSPMVSTLFDIIREEPEF
jgi:tetratricopeptide (TPR) repeat protein